MSYVTFSPNEVVYVKQIGYATLLSCGSRSQISHKVEALPHKKQSIYFDPDLFNSDGDSNHSKKSHHSKSDDEKPEKKPTEPEKPEKLEKQSAQNGPEKKQEVQAEAVNIVQARLEGGTGVIYTSEKNITKSIILVVKSFLITRKEQTIVEIDIAKTIDTLKKQIFTQLGEQIAQYYNVRLFACNPTMAELNVPSKTITQCQIKDNAKLILTADYAFTFRPVAPNKNSKYKVTLTNNTLVSSKIVEEPKKADEKPIPLPPPPPPAPAATQTKPEEKKPQDKAQISAQVKTQGKPEKAEQKKEQCKVEQAKKQADEAAEQQKIESGPYNAKCAIDFSSGIRYWQIKIEKLPIDQEDLVIGLCVQSAAKEPPPYWRCDYAWAYQVVTGKKVFVERDQATNGYQEELEPYGYAIRQNDTLGVLLQIKGKRAILTFYKNLVSCGEAYSIDLASLKSERKELTPFINIGGESQVTLDSKASLPLDSYRLK